MTSKSLIHQLICHSLEESEEFGVKGKDYEIPATGKDYISGHQRFKWSSWSSCRAKGEGQQEYKQRTRINPKKGKMEGQSEICVSSKVCPVAHRIKNGKIMPNKGCEYIWSSWTSCSEGQEYKHRRRINPKKGKMEGQSEICVSSKVGPGWHQGKGAENLSS